MANPKKTTPAVTLPDELGQDAAPKPSRKKRILKILAILLLLLILIVGGFFLGIYLRIFDTNEVNERMGLSELPVIGQFFVKPAPKTGSTLPEAEDPAAAAKQAADEAKTKVEDKASRPVVLTKAEIEKQTKARQAEEKKRVSKLARLYNEMKPQEAADVMDALDDDMTIAILQRMDESQAAKVLAKFDPDKSARLTKIMYTGVPAKVQNQQGQQNGGQAGSAAAAQPADAAQNPNP